MTVSIAISRADHGKDFILLDDYFLPDPFHLTLIGNAEFQQLPGDDELSFEQGMLVGLFPRVAFGTAFRFIDEGDGSWSYNSISPSLQFQLTPPEADLPFRLGLSLSYTFAENSGSAHQHSHSGTPVLCGPEYGPDAPSCDEVDLLGLADDGHTHTHDGINSHGVNALKSRLLLQLEVSHSVTVVGNLLMVVPEGGKAAWGYGLGARYAFNHDVGVGLEAVGDFDSHGEHTLMSGFYYNLSHEVTLKLGAGIRLSDGDGDPAVLGGYTWRF